MGEVVDVVDVAEVGVEAETSSRARNGRLSPFTTNLRQGRKTNLDSNESQVLNQQR